MSDTNLKAAALIEVNRLRAEHDLAPIDALPVGMPSRCDRCPVANALSNGVVAQFWPGWKLQIGEHEMEPPNVLSEFGYAFDQGRFPELIA